MFVISVNDLPELSLILNKYTLNIEVALEEDIPAACWTRLILAVPIIVDDALKLTLS